MITNSLSDRGIVTRSQLANELGLESDTLRAWEREGMPSIRRGNVVLYNMDDVVNWIKKTPIKQRGRKKKE